LLEEFRSVWKNCWSEVERIFLETQKDFFVRKILSYICKRKTQTTVESDSEGVFDDGEIGRKAVEEMGYFNGFLKFYN